METIQISQSIATTVVDKRENLCFIGESYALYFILGRSAFGPCLDEIRRYLLTFLFKELKVMERRFYFLSKQKLQLDSVDVL